MINMYKLTFVVIIFIATIYLQIRLSKNENRLMGLILPAISLINSILIILNIVVTDNDSIWSILGLLISTFIISNIPTIIFLIIYISGNHRKQKIKEIKKMKIRDL